MAASIIYHLFSRIQTKVNTLMLMAIFSQVFFGGVRVVLVMFTDFVLASWLRGIWRSVNMLNIRNNMNSGFCQVTILGAPPDIYIITHCWDYFNFLLSLLNKFRIDRWPFHFVGMKGLKGFSVISRVWTSSNYTPDIKVMLLYNSYCQFFTSFQFLWTTWEHLRGIGNA